jgi:hypothetical protein
MAELADALDSGSSRGNSVDVQVILAASIFQPIFFERIACRNPGPFSGGRIFPFQGGVLQLKDIQIN